MVPDRVALLGAIVTEAVPLPDPVDDVVAHARSDEALQLPLGLVAQVRLDDDDILVRLADMATMGFATTA